MSEHRRGAVSVTWQEEVDDALRGLASGFVIGVPVVFTVDSWWLGDQLSPQDALFLIGAAYLLTLAAVYWIGFRRGLRHGWQLLADALEALALAVLALIAVFWALGQIGDGQAVSIVVGRIAVAAVPTSLGIAVANHLLPRDASRALPDAGDEFAQRFGGKHTGWRLTLLELAAAAAGAAFLCLAIVPVDDMSAVTTAVPVSNLPRVILLSVMVSYAIVFAAGFAGEQRRLETRGPFQHPVVETVSAYVIALCVAVASLWLFGRIDADTPWFVVYMNAVLLGFPASVAAAAGRLAV